MNHTQHCLAGRRFALMGFERPEEESILAALANARGIGHVVGGAPGIPGVQGLYHFSRFDAGYPAYLASR